MDQINRVKDIPFPVYESFPEWEARAAMDARENGDFNTNDPFGSQGVNGSTPMPYLGETKVIIIVTLLNAYRSWRFFISSFAIYFSRNFILTFSHIQENICCGCKVLFFLF